MLSVRAVIILILLGTLGTMIEDASVPYIRYL
jgi:hypothetical protein